jgi:Bifunctional DNA primase/polymerase, N-terminal
MNTLQNIAAEYASHGLTVIPALPRDKAAAVNWKPFQVEAPSEVLRNAMFAEPGLNIAVVCGSVSGNFLNLDCETSRAFDREYDRCNRAGLSDTWVVRSPSGGGHISFRLPFPIKSRGKVNDVEIKAQDTYCLAPPSVAVSKVDGSLQSYQFANRSPTILTVESLDQLHWLHLERASLHLAFRSYPRKAQRLLKGEWERHRYGSRSEVEQAIVTVLVNAGYSFDQILSAFNNNPAAGKFSELQHKDPGHAVDWLRRSYNEARAWTVTQSAARKNALELLHYAHSIPWRGRSGSSQRAVFIAHCGLAYRCGGPTYHASVRDIAELAGVDKNTASTATARLCAAGALNLVQESAFNFASRFELPNFRDLEEQTKFHTLTTTPCEGVYEVSSFLLPEAFRSRGLGRSAFEVLQAINPAPLSAQQIAEKSGRNVQTVRGALKRLKPHGLVVKAGKLWYGCALKDIDLDHLSRAVGMKGAAIHQRERHKAERLRHRLRSRLRECEHGDRYK